MPSQSDLSVGFLGLRCLVTGGAGFIGSNLTRALLNAGARVTVIDNFSTGRRENLPDDPNLAVIEVDLTTWSDLSATVASSDYVFHLAAQVGNIKSISMTEQDAATNVLGSVRLFKSCVGTSVKKVVYSGSSAIFGEAERIPIHEDHPQQPASFYALSKMAGEKYALLATSLWNVPALCLRYFNVYGQPMEDNEYTGVISIFSRRLAASEPLVIYGDGEQFRDFVSVADVVQANLRAALYGRPGRTYNIGSGERTSVRQLAEMMSAIEDRQANLVFREPRAGEVGKSLADITRASAELGYAPAFDLRRGLIALRESVRSRPIRTEAIAVTPATRVAVAIDGAEMASWLAGFDFAAHGLRYVPLRLEGSGSSGEQVTVRTRAVGSSRRMIPDLADVVAGLQETRADAVLLLSDGIFSQLVSFAAGLLDLQVFSLIVCERQLLGEGSQHAGGGTSVLFLADATLFPAAVGDPRYGLRLLPTGHPARDLWLRTGTGDRKFEEARFGDGRAAARMLGAIRRWAAGDRPVVPELSIVVPAYREAANLPIVSERLTGMLERTGLHGEILLVDDASPDDTYAAALNQMWRSPMIRAFTKPTPRGMGNAVRYGLRYARSSFVAVTMGDASDEVDRIPEMLRQVRDGGHALAIGSRYRSRGNYQAVPRLYRFWSACFRFTARTLVGLRLRDYTNAFRLFDTRIFARYGPESGGFEISPEITFKAWLASKRVTEVDVKHLKRASGQSSFSFLRAGAGYGRILIKASVARVSGRWFTLDW